MGAKTSKPVTADAQVQTEAPLLQNFNKQSEKQRATDVYQTHKPRQVKLPPEKSRKRNASENHKKESLIHVAAIDLGSSCSGWAFSFKHEFDEDPTKVHGQTWTSGIVSSHKCPTCILLRCIGEDTEFVAFGYEAESQYARLTQTQRRNGYYFFRRFKTIHSGKLAGIPDENLSIATEQEAASMYCQHVSFQQPSKCVTVAPPLPDFKTRMKYIVLDAGGSSFAVTVHEFTPSRQQTELHTAKVESCGGVSVNEAYTQFLIKLVGATVLKKFQQEQLVEYVNMSQEFEMKKRASKTDEQEKITISVPSTLMEIYKQETGQPFGQALEDSVFAGKIIKRKSTPKMDIQISVFKELYKTVIDQIVNYLGNLFLDQNKEHFECLMLVGGFADSKLLETAIRNAFPQLPVTAPPDAALAVLKGAVICGHKTLRL